MVEMGWDPGLSADKASALCLPSLSPSQTPSPRGQEGRGGRLWQVRLGSWKEEVNLTPNALNEGPLPPRPGRSAGTQLPGWAGP